MGIISSAKNNVNILYYAILQKRIFMYNISRKVTSFPPIFQIQTINQCNATCEMCPISKMSKQKPERMPDQLFEKIIKEISREHLDNTFVYPYLQNEPLMDKDIFKKLKQIKKLGNRQISTGLVTNGTLFTTDKIKELVESDVDEIIISLDAYTEETYNKIRKGLNFKKVLENIEKIQNSNYKNYLAVKYVVQKDNISELNDFKNNWKKKGIKFQIDYLTNRSGDLNSFQDLCLEKKSIPYKTRAKSFADKMFTRGCHYPILVFNILSNGDVILCCNDYSKKLIMGNIKEDSIKEIWNSQKYQKIRKLLFYGEYEKIPVCRNCSIGIRSIS